MCSLKRNFHLLGLIAGLTATTALHATESTTESATTADAPAGVHGERFVRLDRNGQPLQQAGGQSLTGHCVLDSDTGLIWETKTDDGTLQDTHQTYTWFVPDAHSNGGFAGYANRGQCILANCNTQAYIDAINDSRLCGYTQWRLPSREELRSLVDYTIPYPGPVTDQRFFPHAQSQFYWSSIADAGDKDSAWGIGFAFGYDYSYFKSDLGYLRLVYGPRQ